MIDRKPIPNPTGVTFPCTSCGQTGTHAPGCLIRPITRDERAQWLQDHINNTWKPYAMWCRRCRSRAVHHPKTKHIVACPGCGIITTGVVLSFTYTRPPEAA